MVGKMKKKKKPNKTVTLGVYARELAKKWYDDDYGGYHWGTANEIVEEFIMWLHKSGYYLPLARAK